MTRVLHVVVGPAQHGVVRHATAVARACGDELIRFEEAWQVRIAAGHDIVHIPYADRLFGASCEAGAAAFERLAGEVSARGSRLSVTLHDVPAGTAPLAVRRRSAYQRVAARAAGIVVSSHHEYAAATSLLSNAVVSRVVPLPVDDRIAAPAVPTGRSVAVLGFVYPDRGYEHVLDELPPHSGLVALGRAADGHQDLPQQIAGHARRVRRDWRVTGFLPDEELSEQLLTIAVPVAPNRSVGASASIATWLAHGRRPLVAAGAYADELNRLWPQSIQSYDADRPGALREAIRHALADPSSTVLGACVATGPSLTEVAAGYRDYFRAVRPSPVLTSGAVPGNRWDLLAGRWPPTAPAVSVVIPYYESQRQLDLVLTALRLQTHPAHRLEVIVADDGSRRPPDLSAAAHLDCRCVRQPDHGFRAAAARNLGAAAARGDVLAFLDGDTIPEPEYVRRLTRLPSLLREALVVGRRRHADFGGWDGDRLRRWLAGDEAGPPELSEPSWLSDGYRWSRDLLDVDARSYRYVISAVMAMSREFFNAVGGFCEEFTSYGGEDWELAYRAYNAGAVMAHVAEAIAWHDGPEWAERPGDRAAEKMVEERRLRRLVPDRALRGAGQWMPYPAVVVCLKDSDLAAVGHTALTAFSSGTDCGVWVCGPGAAMTVADLDDPRIRLGPPPDDALARARVVVDLERPANLSTLQELTDAAEACGEVRISAGRLRSSRAMGIERRHPVSPPAGGGGVERQFEMRGQADERYNEHSHRAQPGARPRPVAHR